MKKKIRIIKFKPTKKQAWEIGKALTVLTLFGFVFNSTTKMVDAYAEQQLIKDSVSDILIQSEENRQEINKLKEILIKCGANR